MRNIETADRQSYRRMTTDELRSRFVIGDLFRPGQVSLVYTDADRAVVGGIVPETEELELTGGREMACSYFCERREVGILNLGEPGTVVVDGTEYALARRECLYIRRGSRGLLFSSANPQKPAHFYLVSYPAHADYPTVKAGLKDANRIELGTLAESNRRTLHQYIRPGFIRSCQLVMGFTELHEGSVWNSFPPHTHGRRTEVYCYFDLPPNGAVLHLLGEPDETRHVLLREKQAVLSPAWSVHCGAGTGGYAFVWAMGGENQEFDDMDKCDLASFR
ncbi:MAG: 5-dehydro-4-deoxy-D-glucuronate isomerase [Kiritimatiellia bacterium]|jgi:4-deoxy-L-threo-5-hexosulose-uronate ketol-isomerase|nr:5-dehydro-4-deoxy-D-glucuronate isomerase [Kiritimatiellia bacterium]